MTIQYLAENLPCVSMTWEESAMNAFKGTPRDSAAAMFRNNRRNHGTSSVRVIVPGRMWYARRGNLQYIYRLEP